MSLKFDLYYPFNYAIIFGCKFSDADLEYINNVIYCDKIYRMVLHAHNTLDPNQPWWDIVVEFSCLINFLEKFMNDKDCPNGVKYFIYQFIGQIFGKWKLDGLYDLYKEHSFLTDLWMDKTRGGGGRKYSKNNGLYKI